MKPLRPWKIVFGLAAFGMAAATLATHLSSHPLLAFAPHGVTSDRDAKTHFQETDERAVLQAAVRLPALK